MSEDIEPLNEQTRTRMVCPATMNERDSLQSVTVRIKEDTSRRPDGRVQPDREGQTNEVRAHTHPDRRSDRSISSPLSQGRPKGAANVSLPSLFICQRSERSRQRPRYNGPTDWLALMCAKRGAEQEL